MSAPQWRGGALDLRAALRSGGNLLFGLFVAAVLAFTLLAAVHSAAGKSLAAQRRRGVSPPCLPRLAWAARSGGAPG